MQDNQDQKAGERFKIMIFKAGGWLMYAATDDPVLARWGFLRAKRQGFEVSIMSYPPAWNVLELADLVADF